MASLSSVTVSSDREGVVDAVLRLVEGIDLRDRDLLASAFTEDAVFDLSGLDESAGTFEPYVGRDVIADTLMAHVGRLDTMHAVSNVRVAIDGDEARLTSYLVGQHFRPGEGASADFGDHLWLGNRFETELVRHSEYLWLIRHHRVTSMWALGNVAATKLP